MTIITTFDTQQAISESLFFIPGFIHVRVADRESAAGDNNISK